MTDVPRNISSMTRLVLSGRRTTLVSARRMGYGKPRSSRGSMPGQPRAACLEDLLADLGNGQHDRMDETVRAEEEAEIGLAATEPLGRVAHRGQRQVRPLGAA